MGNANALTLVGIVILLSACKAGGMRTDVPARITNPTQNSRAELQRVVTDALGGRQVRIADDALTSDNQLIIEPANLTGRDFGRPEHFRLVLSGSQCVLVHQDSQARLALAETTCAAE